MGLVVLKGQIGFKSWVILIVSILMAVYHLYFATLGFLTEMTWRAGHLLFAAVLILLSYPITSGKSGWRVLDWLLILFAIVAGFYIIIEYPNMSLRMGAPLVRDVVIGAISIVIVLEITRRTLGWPLLTIAVFFLLYALFGNYLPGIISHRGFDFDRVVTQTYMTLEGITASHWE